MIIMEKTAKLILLCVSLFLAMFLYKVPFRTYAQSEGPLVFIDVAYVNATADQIGQQITVNINVSNIQNLWTWGLGLKWDPTVLNCTGFYEGEFLKRGGSTLWMEGSINNTLGRTDTPYGCTLQSGGNPVSGSGQLAYATFEIVGQGHSCIHLLDCVFVNGNLQYIPLTILDRQIFVVDEEAYLVTVITNSTGSSTPWEIHSYQLLLEDPEEDNNPSLSFNITISSPYSEVGACNVTIPLDFMWGPEDLWYVKINGEPPISFNIAQNESHCFLYFVYPQSESELRIKISSPEVVPEFPFLSVGLAIIASLTAIILYIRKHCT